MYKIQLDGPSLNLPCWTCLVSNPVPPALVIASTLPQSQCLLTSLSVDLCIAIADRCSLSYSYHLHFVGLHLTAVGRLPTNMHFFLLFHYSKAYITGIYEFTGYTWKIYFAVSSVKGLFQSINNQANIILPKKPIFITTCNVYYLNFYICQKPRFYIFFCTIC